MPSLKERLSGIVGLLVAMSLAACGSAESPNIVDGDHGNATNNITKIEQEPVRTPQRYALHEAAQRGLIEYRITGNGGSSGEALEITLRRTTPEPIELYVDPGSVFRPDSSGAQSMVARSFVRELAEQIAEGIAEHLVDDGGTIHLDDDAEHRIVIEAYCRDLELANPSAQDGFTFASVDARAAALLAAARARGLSLDATQAAVWMDRGATADEIREHYDATDREFEQASQLVASLPRS